MSSSVIFSQHFENGSVSTSFTVNSCLQFVETELALKAGSELIDQMGGFVPMDTVVKGITLQIYEKCLVQHPYAVENRKA